MQRIVSIAGLVCLMAMGLAACEQEGPAERAGEKIDEAVEKAGDKLEQAGDRIEEAGDRAQKEMQQ